MKKLFPLLVIPSAILLAGFSTAEENGSAGVPMPARVIGEVSDGKPAPPSPPKVLPQHEVVTSKVRRKGGRRIILNRVVPPAPPTPSVKQPVQDNPVQESVSLPVGGTFMVHATVYDDKLTYVQWNHDGRKHGAWSNTNFKLLKGFHNFEGRGRTYGFMMLSGTSTLEALQKAWQGEGNKNHLPEIPDFTELNKRTYPSYILMKGDDKDEESMEFIEAIHDLYEAEHARLLAAHIEREKNRKLREAEQERLKQNPPPKPDVTVNYWKKTPAKKDPPKVPQPESAK